MVVCVRVGDAEAYRDFTEKWWVSIFTKVSPDVEEDLVDARLEPAYRKERLICPALIVRLDGPEQIAILTDDVEELQRHTGGGFAARGVEDVGGQETAHEDLSTVPSIKP